MVDRPVSQRSPSTGTLELGAGRVEAFSDAVMAVMAVMAVIITTMAFSLRPPHGVTWAAVRAMLPGLLVYILSFVLLAPVVPCYHTRRQTASSTAMGLLNGTEKTHVEPPFVTGRHAPSWPRPVYESAALTN
jgi:hypothetical protein